MVQGGKQVCEASHRDEAHGMVETESWGVCCWIYVVLLGVKGSGFALWLAFCTAHDT